MWWKSNMATQRVDEKTYQASDVMTVVEACEFLAVHRNTLYRLIQHEGLPAFKLSVGGKWRLRRSDLAQWIEDKQGRRHP